jgi:LPXTG-motif cell wall-anchored protein
MNADFEFTTKENNLQAFRTNNPGMEQWILDNEKTYGISFGDKTDPTANTGSTTPVKVMLIVGAVAALALIVLFLLKRKK